MLIIGAVLTFCAIGVGLAVFSGLVGRRPEMAAVVLLVAVGAADMLVAVVGVLGLGATDLGSASAVVGDAVDVVYDRQRLGVGLAAAAGFVGLAVWLVLTGDWQRPDDPD